MKAWLEENMPSFLETVRDEKSLQEFQDKAERNGLPQVLIFTSKAKSSALTKYLSTEYRRRLLLAEVFPTKPNKAVMDKYGIKDLPAMLVIPPGSTEPILFEGDKFKKHKLESFLSKHALKEKVYKKKKKQEDGTNDQAEPSKEKVKTEL